jgi:hypothetical protein
VTPSAPQTGQAAPTPTDPGPAPVGTTPSPTDAGSPAPASTQPSAPPAAPGTTSPPPTPSAIVSSTATQAVTQIQISGCISNCQDLNQTQSAQQQALGVQILEAGAQLGSGPTPQDGSGSSGQPGTGSSGQTDAGSSPVVLTTTITQIQLACVIECFDSTSSDPATATAAQQILAELTSILSPAAPPSPAPVPALEQSTTTQTSCQQQDGQSPAQTQVQNASQISTTIQAVSAALGLTPTPGGTSGSLAPVVQAISQFVQSTWQLQIGCLFYCVDTQQVQQAHQSVTAVAVVPGPLPGSTEPAGSSQTTGSAPSAGSTSAVVTVVIQVIWQVQIGCLSWCYDSTQLQQATTQSTVVLVPDPAPTPTTPAPTPTTPAPTPAPGPDTPAPAPGPDAPAGAVAAPGSAVPGNPARASGSTAIASSPGGAPRQEPILTPLPRLNFPREAGRALLTIVWVRVSPAPANPVISPAPPIDPQGRVESRRAPRSIVYVGVLSEPSAPRPAPRRHPTPSRAPYGNAAPASVVQDRVGSGRAGDSLLDVALGLILVGALSSYAIRRVRAGAASKR